MFADLMHFDNLRRNILEFVTIIKINFVISEKSLVK